jgi:hypothetical protein
MEILVTKSIPRNELTAPKDYVGFLFKNEGGVFNICRNVEDVIKSNQWFNNLPLKTQVVNDEKIEIGDKFLAICASEELNGKIFKYVGIANIGEGLITIEGLDGIKTTTPQLLETSYKWVRKPTREDKEKLVNGKITEYAV